MAAGVSLRVPRALLPWKQQTRSIVTNYSARAKLRKLEKKGDTWKYGEKLKVADRAWEEQAMRIRAGAQQGLWQTLKERGYIHQVAGDETELERVMIDKRVGIYAGIDPTGPSMHVGHLLPFMVLLWFYVHGYRAVSLLGGATASVGDPIGRTTHREKQESSIRKVNMAAMHLQITNIWENMETYAMRNYGYKREEIWRRALVNNNRWLNKLPLMEYTHYALQSVSRADLFSRTKAKQRLEDEEDDGISMAELTYPIMQGWDWWELYKQQDVQIQLGGSDQFGNIITGLKLVNRIVPQLVNEKVEPEKFGPNATRFGFTVPLLTTSGGEKIGKSAGNAVWLDQTMTSPFDLYGYFLRLSDSDVIRSLKLFTLMPLADVEVLAAEHNKNPSKRLAHHRLALDVLTLVHGGPCATQTAELHHALFTKKIMPPSMPKNPNRVRNSEELSVQLNPNAVPISSESLWNYHGKLPQSLVHSQSPARILYHAGLVSSRSEGQRLINVGGAYYGGETGMEKRSLEDTVQMPDELKFVKIRSPDVDFTPKMIIDERTIILRTGKKKVKIITIVEDSEFDAEGLTAPGWQEWKDNAAKEDGT